MQIVRDKVILDTASSASEWYPETIEENYLRVRRFHPEFNAIPTALLPWPYRHPDSPLPEYCPTCGRHLVEFTWGIYQSGNTGYWERGCLGRMQWLARMFPSILFWTSHFRISLGRARPRKREMFDATTGQPMDGPPQKN